MTDYEKALRGLGQAMDELLTAAREIRDVGGKIPAGYVVSKVEKALKAWAPYRPR